MLLEGSVMNGAIVLDAPADLPDGTRVRVEPVPADAGPPARRPSPEIAAILEKWAREDASGGAGRAGRPEPTRWPRSSAACKGCPTTRL